MKVSFLLILLALFACSPDNKNRVLFSAAVSQDEEWETYEGNWRTSDGIIHFELSLKMGAFGHEASYQLIEAFESDRSSSGVKSEGLYSTYDGSSKKELGICLHDVSTYDKGSYLRFKKSGDDGAEEEMFFVARGTEELIPCDSKFNSLTTDWRYTLHKRSKLFTAEGYFTLGKDSVEFFERNTRENWMVADLGEFSKLSKAYKQFADDQIEGIYLKALAYSVADSSSLGSKKLLVIKQIKRIGKDPD